MNWIKDAFLDVAILLIILALSYFKYPALEIILWVYTGLLLLSKILAFFVGFLQNKVKNTSVPEWFYHVIYLCSTGILIFVKLYYLGAAWALIWILSTISSLKSKGSGKVGK